MNRVFGSAPSPFGAVLVLSAVLIFSFAMPTFADEQMPDVVYAPSLAYRISSQVEIGIEKEGRYEKLITNERDSSTSNSGSRSSNTTTLNERDTKKVRKKTTNPRKRASRPKASGLLGGVVRAVGGDYSGLVQWGGGFLDHMMEPRYNWDVTETYSTRENTKTTTSQSIASSWKSTSHLSEVITQELKYNINKGFIQFTVSLTNAGERTIHINKPNFVVHFVEEDGSEVFAGSARVLNGLQAGGTISPNQSYLLQVRAENLDFLDLSDKYRRASGIRIALQDLKVRRGGKELAVSEVQERLQDSHVQFDYYDGNRRSTRYLRVQPGISLEDFLTHALASKNYRLGSDGSEALVQEVNGLESHATVFADLRREPERFAWRRWFTSVVDDNGRVFEASRESRLYPGYSVKLGYFGAKDILPSSKYRPVVYRKPNVSLDTDSLYQLELDLAPGDIIEFTDLKFGKGFYLNKVEFSITAASHQEVQNWLQQRASANRGMVSGSYAGGFGGGIIGGPPPGGGGFESIVQRIKKGDTNAPGFVFQPAPSGGPFYKLTPHRVRRVPVHPESLVLNRRDDFGLSESEALLILRAMQCQGLKDRFVHYRNNKAAGPLQFRHASISYNAPPGQRANLRQMMAQMGMLRRPGESDDAFLRRWLREDQVLQFEVTEPVSRADNYWRFAAPKAQIASGYIQLPKEVESPPSSQSGFLFSDGATFGPLEIQPPRPFGFTRMPFGPPWGSGDPRKYLYLPDLDSPFIVVGSGEHGLQLPGKTGSEITATLQVVRYGK